MEYLFLKPKTHTTKWQFAHCYC